MTRVSISSPGVQWCLPTFPFPPAGGDPFVQATTPTHDPAFNLDVVNPCMLHRIAGHDNPVHYIGAMEILIPWIGQRML